MSIKKTLVLWIFLACIFAVIIGSINLPTFYRLRQNGMAADSIVTGLTPKDHNTFSYSFKLGSETYTGRGSIDELGGRGIGAHVPITYVADSPVLSASGNVHERFQSEIQSTISGALFLSFFLAIAISYELGRGHSLTEEKRVLTGRTERKMSDGMTGLRTLKPGDSFQLKGFARIRFAVNWLSFAMCAIGFAIYWISGYPADMDFSQRIMFSLFVPLLLFGGAKLIIPMVWKIEVEDSGIVFHSLFQRQFVPWNTLTDVAVEHWGSETYYRVSHRGGQPIRLSSGMDREDEIVQELCEHVTELA
ncbi:MAG: hypothetical protein JSS83_07895 [Cyanobacteria bacterium SZAS LIN-3]|nr:hypothetical protein [Cyanobacteria bacterium SZAS LIN-3]